MNTARTLDRTRFRFGEPSDIVAQLSKLIAEPRDSPLTPQDNPLACFDEIASTVLNLKHLAPYRENNTDTKESVDRILRTQFYYLVHELIDDDGFPAPDNWAPTDENWNKVISYFQTYDLKWNPDEQAYSKHNIAATTCYTGQLAPRQSPNDLADRN